MNDIVIIGSGGFAKEVLTLIRQINSVRLQEFGSCLYHVLGFIDNDDNKIGQVINGVPVIGDENYLKNGLFMAAMGIGQPHIKKRIIDRLGSNITWPNLIHPNVIFSMDEQDQNIMGVGNIITASNVLTCNVSLGNHTMLNLSCTIGHETIVGDYAVISPGANISGNVIIGEGAYIGTNATILEKVIVGKWATIGAGALVNKQVVDNATVVGVPAKFIKQKPNGWHIA